MAWPLNQHLHHLLYSMQPMLETSSSKYSQQTICIMWWDWLLWNALDIQTALWQLIKVYPCEGSLICQPSEGNPMNASLSWKTQATTILERSRRQCAVHTTNYSYRYADASQHMHDIMMAMIGAWSKQGLSNKSMANGRWRMLMSRILIKDSSCCLVG